MGRGPTVSDEVKILIGEIWGASRVRNRIYDDENEVHTAKKIRAELEKPVYADRIKGRDGKGKVPGISYIYKVLQTIKQRETNNEYDATLDAEWSLGTLRAHPFPPEAIPLLLKIREQLPGKYLSVRNAYWLYWLHRFVEDPTELSEISACYCLYERSCDLVGIECDTHVFDEATPEKTLENLKGYINSFKNRIVQIIVDRLNEKVDGGK